MALDPTRLVARSLMRSWYFRPARLASAVAAGIAGVLLTTAVLVVYFAVYDALRGAPITAVRDGIVAVEASAPGGMAPSVVEEVGKRTGLPTTTMLVVSASRVDDDGGTTPMLVFGVDTTLGDFVDDDLAKQTREHPLGADEVYLAAAWAEPRGIKAGDKIRVGGTTDVRSWTVAAVLRGEVANRGSVIVAPRPVVAEAFGRGTFTDAILIDQKGRDRAQVVAEAEDAVDGAGAVKDPQDLLSGYRKSFQTFLTILSMFAVIAVLTAGVVLFLTWRLALDDARPALARMRLTGVRTSHLMLGSAAVMLPILLVSYVIGVVLGVVVGGNLGSFTRQITDLSQQAVTPGTPWQLPALGALVAVILMFAAAWVSGVRRFTKVQAIEAVSGRGEIAVLPGGHAQTVPDRSGAPGRRCGGRAGRPRGRAGGGAGAAAGRSGAAQRRAAGPHRTGAAQGRTGTGAAGGEQAAPAGVAAQRGAVRDLHGVRGGGRRDGRCRDQHQARGGVVGRAVDRGRALRPGRPAGHQPAERDPAEGAEPELRAVNGVEAVTTFSFTYLELDGRRVQVWELGQVGPGPPLAAHRHRGTRGRAGPARRRQHRGIGELRGRARRFGG